MSAVRPIPVGYPRTLVKVLHVPPPAASVVGTKIDSTLLCRHWGRRLLQTVPRHQGTIGVQQSRQVQSNVATPPLLKPLKLDSAVLGAILLSIESVVRTFSTATSHTASVVLKSSTAA